MPQVLHRISTVAAENTTTSGPITSSYPAMSAQEITEANSPIIIYLQECVAHRTLTTLLHVIPCDTYVSIHHIESGLKYIQALTAHHTTMIIPNTKDANTIFHQLPPLISFEPFFNTKVQ